MSKKRKDRKVKIRDEKESDKNAEQIAELEASASKQSAPVVSPMKKNVENAKVTIVGALDEAIRSGEREKEDHSLRFSRHNIEMGRTDEKNLLLSKTFWGVVILVLAPNLKWFGIDLDAEDYTIVGSEIITGIGALLAIIGRIGAKRKIRIPF